MDAVLCRKSIKDYSIKDDRHMIRKRKAEKELLLKKLTGSAPYDLERSGVLKSMTLSQLRIVDRMIEEVQKKSTYMMKCKNCQKLNAGMVMYNGFEWKYAEDEHLPFRMGFDRETETILVPEEMLMYFIQLANPGQPKHRIQLF